MSRLMHVNSYRVDAQLASVCGYSHVSTCRGREGGKEDGRRQMPWHRSVQCVAQAKGKCLYIVSYM